jgi:hypothetical protein
MMGMRGLKKERYFAQFLGENVCGMSEVQQFSGDVASRCEGRGSLSEGDEGNRGLTGLALLPLPLHRELHPALIHLPESLSIPAPITSTGEDFCISVHTDEEALEEELVEERELDEADSLLAHQHEVELWKQVGLDQKQNSTRRETRRGRKRRRI